MKQPKFKEGDVVWYVWGESPPIIVQCTVVEVIDHFVKKYGDAGRYFYTIDEPVGHDVGTDELHKEFLRAAREVLLRNMDNDDVREEEGLPREETILGPAFLNERRQTAIDFIIGTWAGKAPPDAAEKLAEDLAPKRKGHEWFDVEDAIAYLRVEAEKNMGKEAADSIFENLKESLEEGITALQEGKELVTREVEE